MNSHQISGLCCTPWLSKMTTCYPPKVNSTLCTSSLQLEQIIHRSSQTPLFLSSAHLSPPPAIRARGVDSPLGQQGRDDLLCQQREGLDVEALDAAQEILEADIDQRLHPLDGLPRRCR
jgi:hypothetical protein